MSGHLPLHKPRVLVYSPATKQWLCGRGGIGRRAALRSLWGNTRGSSSLLGRTKIAKVDVLNQFHSRQKTPLLGEYRLTHLHYRQELDGVRAIAVASVVLFHVGFSDFSGGYSGVDIFFVLSGYLICGQAFLRIQDQSYSVTDFFARRIRRLSSAYFFCFLVTALVANALFLRSEMDEIFRNLLGSITFTNNFNLLNTQGYFNNDSEGNPFLHTWSLSIEEQFYIVLPLVILATRYSLAAFKTTIVVLFIVSMALMLFSGDLIYDREERFFATSFRVWELALGALVFLLVQHRGMLSAIPFAPILGMMLVLGPVFLLEKGVLYPGWVTLIPTFGVAVLIATCTPETSRTGRFLASRPMSYVGRISYGALGSARN